MIVNNERKLNEMIECQPPNCIFHSFEAEFADAASTIK